MIDPLELADHKISTLRSKIDEMCLTAKQHTMPRQFYEALDEKRRQLTEWEQMRAASSDRISSLEKMLAEVGG